jgi:hypothetical protein
MKKRIWSITISLTVILITLACQLPFLGTSTSPGSDPNILNTQVAMSMTQTAMNSIPLAPANPPGASTDPGLVNTQVALAITQTAMSNPTLTPTNTNTPLPPPPTELDIQALIDSSEILIYEDMIGYPQYGAVVAKALKSIGGHHVYVGDAIGTLMNELNSGTDWDLIIIASEARGAVSGDYWDVIQSQVDDGAALVAEMWFLDSISAGKISPLLYECGVEFQADWQRAPDANPLDFDMYWSVPDSPVFNTPNTVTRFAASLLDPVWDGDVGDLMKLRSGSDATILASHASGQDQSMYGLITSCLDGRMILQTFDTHDYPTDPMLALWQNYIIYTLTNHFLTQ